MSDLESILNGDEDTGLATQEPEKEQETPAPEATKGEDDAPPASSDEQKTVPVSALLDERRKRQELEQRLQEQEQKPAPDVLENPEGFAQHVNESVNYALQNQAANMSEEIMRMEMGDEAFEQKYQAFVELTQSNPDMGTKAMASPLPYHFALSEVDKAEKAKSLENVDEYEAKIRAGVEAKIRAEVLAEVSAKAQQTASITPSLAGTSSAGTVGSSTWSGPAPLEDIFGD